MEETRHGMDAIDHQIVKLIAGRAELERWLTKYRHT
jgi:chorismate mutase